MTYRFSSDLGALEGDCLVMIKLGFFWHSFKGLWYFLRYSRSIAESGKEAKEWGLYSTEFFIYSHEHAGLIQYWRSFSDLENWACNNRSHTGWWKEVESKNSDKYKHISIYHEVYLIENSNIETVYNLHPKLAERKMFPSLSSFLPHISPTKYRARDRFQNTENSKK